MRKQATKNWRESYKAIDAAGWEGQTFFRTYRAFRQALADYAEENGVDAGEVIRAATAKKIGWKGPLHHPSVEENGYTIIDLTLDEVAWIRYLKCRRWTRTQISRKLRISISKIDKMLIKDLKRKRRMKYFPSIPMGGECPPWFIPEKNY